MPDYAPGKKQPLLYVQTGEQENGEQLHGKVICGFCLMAS